MNTSPNAPDINVIRPPSAYTVFTATQVRSGPPAGPLGIPDTVVPQDADSSSDSLRTFLKAKPRVLGVAMAVIAWQQFPLATTLFTYQGATLFSGILFWGSVCYMITGCLTCATHYKFNICWVKRSLVMNIISSVISIIAMILICVDLSLLPRSDYYQKVTNGNGSAAVTSGNSADGYAFLSSILFINLLLFCMFLPVSIFGCRSLTHKAPTVPQVIMIQNDIVVSMNPSTALPLAHTEPPPQFTVTYV